MPIKKFNVKAGLSVGTSPIVDVIDSDGNSTFDSTTTNVLIVNNDANVIGNLTVTGNIFGNLVVESANYATISGSANTSIAVTGNAQANITSVGTLSGLTVNGITTLGNIGNVKIAGGSANNVIISNGSGNLSWAAASSVSAYKYTKEWHVDPVGGNDTTGNGSESNPYATITKAFTQVGGNGQAVFLHHGIYNETVTCGLFNVDIVGDIRGGAYQQGTWTFTTNGNSSVRLFGLHFANTVTHTGNAGLYFDRVTSSALISKSGAGLLNVQSSDLSSNAVSVTGNGYVTITNSMVGPLTVNASGAQVVVKDSPQILSVTNTSGVAVVNSSFVFALSNTGNAITSAVGSLTYIQNSSIAAANGAQGRIAMGGFWSTQDTSYDKANSSLTGTNLAVVSHSDAIVTVGSIAAGTSITATGNVSGGNITTANYVKTTTKTVATLASAATVGAGSRSFVSDATSNAFGATAVGGGSSAVPVWSNGTDWLIG